MSLRMAHARAFVCRASRTQTLRWGSTSSRRLPINNGALGGSVVLVGVISAAGLWWSKSASDEVPWLAPDYSSTKPIAFGEDTVQRMLTQAAYSFPVKTIAGINRYDGAQLPSNSPCEDRYMHGQFIPSWDRGKPWMAWAVFDGHSGWQTAELLQAQLLPFLQQSLSKVRPPLLGQPVPEVLVQQSIARAFVELDGSIVNTAPEMSESEQPLHIKMQQLAPAFAGSCALLSLYDPVTRNLHVACTGDSRAVLGQQSSEGAWHAKALSADQTGSNTDEIARLSQEHPGEEDITKDGRVLGLVVSRAFGDGRWKWPVEVQKGFVRKFYAPALSSSFKVETPPYVTAEPVVTSTTIDSEKPSFLIMATDGLWDTVSSEQAVQLVGAWLAGRKNETESSVPVPTPAAFDFGHFWKGVNWKFEEERTTIKDDNAAVHLLRNSLGGNHVELLTGRLSASTPFSRGLRDDITIQVVFLNVPGL